MRRCDRDPFHLLPLAEFRPSADRWRARRSVHREGEVRCWRTGRKKCCSRSVDRANLMLPSVMPLTREKAQLMSASEIDRTLVRLAHEILEKSKDLRSAGIHRHPAARRSAGAAAGPQDRGVGKNRHSGRHPRHQSLSRRPDHGRHQARGQRHRDSLFGAGQRHHPDGRRAVHRPHDPRRARRAVRPRPAGARAVAGADRPRPSRAAHRGALHRPHRADHRQRNHRSEVPGDRRNGEGAAGGEGPPARQPERCPPDCSASKSWTAPRSKRFWRAPRTFSRCRTSR